jgi:hypothetical protein
MNAARSLASLAAAGLALLTLIGSSALDWSEEAVADGGQVVLPPGEARSFLIWVGANEDATEGRTSLVIEGETEPLSGRPLLYAALSWQGTLGWSSGEAFADPSRGEALLLDSAELWRGQDLHHGCDDIAPDDVPMAVWEDEVCWVSLDLELEAIDGDVALDWYALAITEGHGTQGNLIPHPSMTVVIEPID